MNQYLKSVILDTIKKNNISLWADWGSQIYTIKDKDNKELMTVVNAWDYGQYSLIVNQKTVLGVKWYENDNLPPTQDQADIFEIIRACNNKYKEQIKQAEQNKKLVTEQNKLNQQEQQIIAFLQRKKSK